MTRADELYFNQMISESKSELDALNIKYCTNLYWATLKSSRTWGTCRYISPNVCGIKINEALIKSRNNKAIKTTIIHELLHSCKGGNSHTGTWKAYAERVNKAYGYNIKRTTGADEKNISEFINYKYKVVCENCGSTCFYTKTNKFIKSQGKNYSCGRCKHKVFHAFTKDNKQIF